ncbi:MAG: glutamine-hydrolyzing carbamoyl-phosphate synthase small subunit [Candidatus Amulumruptor caecigallinarius]|nr:glutamine-hydrolyzing carbamoyl-phosphate synthase small subunit [Candidatus Amulumruptor caecigallinarius]MCM1396868.1 glutamine-hydrolyzing carbamoyl-phosphate synthase small subunit [Candidatus Amulumruptor caecigallinarius]MCM1454188.1 glutamine-hydrolyzing carbamoyl-phosphate synthase small subunit [bacterium]
MQEPKRALLILEDGTTFEGKSFGYDGSTAGEVVFNTAMTGYPESLTDPSYEGQILVTTYPILGNYGVPPRRQKDDVSEYYESDHIHAKAIVAQDYSFNHSHWQADRSLADWLKEEKITGIYGIDTRALTKHLREHGSMLGKITVEGSPEVDFYDPNQDNLVAKASCTSVEEHGAGDKTVVLIDCGVKHNIIRCLTRRGVKVIRVPWDFDVTSIPYDGLFISNGPGNPDMADKTVETIRKAIEIGKPICGICMGNQLLSKAAGAKTYKLKYGHRSHNQPVRQCGTDRCFVTSQNHGFAVDSSTLGDDWEPLFVNMNDGTNEGIRHKTKPFFSAQFHPEASSGPKDTEFIFDDFIALL